MTNELILRSVYGKVNQIYYIQPCPDPITGRLPSCVATVNSNGDMILSEADVTAMRVGEKHFVKANHVFEIVDGYKFNLDDIVDAANWESIKHCNWIAKDRYERTPSGDLVIDGGAKRYGVADLYVDRPGEITKSKVNKKLYLHRACTYVFDDSDAERIKKARVLGRDLRRANPADVTDFLISRAEKEPKKIIELYEGEDWKMHIFILDAIDRGVIRKSDSIYKYDDKMLGGSIEATILFLRDIRYRKILNSIKMETYPELMTKSQIEESDSALLDGTPEEITKPKSTTKPTGKAVKK